MDVFTSIFKGLGKKEDRKGTDEWEDLGGQGGATDCDTGGGCTPCSSCESGGGCGGNFGEDDEYADGGACK